MVDTQRANERSRFFHLRSNSFKEEFSVLNNVLQHNCKSYAQLTRSSYIKEENIINLNHSTVIERLQQEQNAHDLEAFLACFAPNFQGNHPLHPDRGFQKIENVRENWSTIFHDIPDFCC
jgi:hypothetical protein